MQDTDSQIKITCFKQLNIINKQLPLPPRGQYILNIIIYSPNKKLKYLDPVLRQLNENNQLFIVKCNNLSNLQYSLDSCKFGIKTILIMDKEIDQQTVQKILTNQDLIKNKENFICWVFTERVEGVNSSWFHSSSIQLITIDQNKVIDMLKKYYDNVRPLLKAYNSSTTIKSNDQLNLDIKLQIQDSPNKKILDQGNFYSKHDRVFDNGIPGVGTYHIQSNQRHGTAAIMTKGQRVNQKMTFFKQ